MATLYEKDFGAWSLEQAHLLKNKAFDRLDIDHLFEEIQDLGKSDKRALASHLMIVLAHMLKCKYQPEYYTKSWKDTIDEGRLEIQDLIEDSPSLKNYPQDVLPISYRRAVRLASKQTGIDLRKFPDTCPWKLNEILGE